MSDKENLNSGEHKKANPVGRRKFLKVASVSAPIISTIASKPVWAGTCTLSGNMSGNTSTHDREHCLNFQGYSPGGWKKGAANNSGYWDIIKYEKATSIDGIFNNFPALTYKGNKVNKTIQDGAGVPLRCLYNALWSDNSGKSDIKQFVAALLNAALGEASASFDYPYTTDDIIDIYNNADPTSEEYIAFLNLLISSQTID